MIRTCVNPLNTDDHNGPGGDQFCIFCLRKRGDDALMMVGQLAEVLRGIRDNGAGPRWEMQWIDEVVTKAEALLT